MLVMNALGGLGKGVVSLLGGIWAAIDAWSNWILTYTRTNTKTQWVGFVLNWAPLGGMISVGADVTADHGLYPGLGWALACMLNIAFVWPTMNWVLTKLVTKLQTASRYLLRVAILPLLIIAPLAIVANSVSAHPPSAENQATDTVPNPSYSPETIAELEGRLKALSGGAVSTACGILLAKGLATALPVALPTTGPTGGAIIIVIGSACGVIIHEVGGVDAIWSAINHLVTPPVPPVIHPGGHGPHKLSSWCVSKLSGPGASGYPSAAILDTCGPMAKHIVAHRDYEAGPAAHAAERAEA